MYYVGPYYFHHKIALTFKYSTAKGCICLATCLGLYACIFDGTNILPPNRDIHAQAACHGVNQARQPDSRLSGARVPLQSKHTQFCLPVGMGSNASLDALGDEMYLRLQIIIKTFIKRIIVDALDVLAIKKRHQIDHIK